MTHTSTSQPITACRICDSEELRSILFLGYVPPANAMPAIGEPALAPFHENGYRI